MLTRLASAARRTELRMRARAALDACVSMLAISFVAVVLVVTLAKVLFGLSPRWVRDVIGAALLSTLLGTAYAATRRLLKFRGAMALDVHHRLSDRLTNALSFAELPPEARTPLMEMAIDDACARASG